MFCGKCGNMLNDGDAFCLKCGASVNPSNTGGSNNIILSKAEFYNQACSDKVKKEINSISIFGYISAALSLVMAIIAKSPIDIIISLLVFAAALGIKFKRSLLCAGVMLAIGIITFIITISTSGSPGGWLIILAGISGVMTIKKFNKEYRKYLNDPSGYIGGAI